MEALKSYLKKLKFGIQVKRIPATDDFGSYAVATKKGLLVFDKGHFILIENGDFYGLTILKDTLLALKRVKGKKSLILSYSLDDNRLKKGMGSLFLDNLPYGCHQIDYFNNQVYITDTYNNGIFIADVSGKILESYFPLGKLENGRASSNYGHMNSIFFKEGKIYILCHNETSKTKRYSEILVLNEQMELIEKIDTKTSNAHNIVVFRNDMYSCDSLGSNLVKNGEIFVRKDYFTRGLAITDDYIVMGGSEYASRENRSKAGGKIYVLDHNGKGIVDVYLPGMVQEIRRIDKKDYGLSNVNQ